ncbi:MAG TPA: nitroreductase [Microbacterium sp.]|nr:nitroreductase [Microbacterium sp.]
MCLPPLVDDASSLDGGVETLLRERFTCRAFVPTPVRPAVIERILLLAQRAPSWCNTQPWQVEVCSGSATARFRRALLEHVERAGEGAAFDFDPPSTYTGLHRRRRSESGWQLYDAVGVRRGDREASSRQAARNFEFFGAPHVAIVTTPAELGAYGALDAGVYLSTFLLAAQANGVATAPQAALARFAPFVRDYFGIGHDRKVVYGVSFGYADEQHPANSYRTGRAALSETVRFHS